MSAWRESNAGDVRVNIVRLTYQPAPAPYHRRWTRRLAVGLAATLVATATAVGIVSPASAVPATITPGTAWTDTDGKSVQAHGGGMIKVGSTYYWIGEDRANVTAIPAWASGVYTPPFRNITCYSSTDLVRWTFVGNLLSLQSSGDLGPDRVVERPKVIYNAGTGKYVLWMHIDDPTYSDARVGVASSSSVCSGYTYHGSTRPLGYQSRDMTVFKDDDGTAYLAYSSNNNSVLRIARLASDYLSAGTDLGSTPVAGEGIAVFKKDSTYYLLASAATGWKSNDNYYFTASSMAGPWTHRGDFTPNSTDTYNSQTTFVQPVSGDSGTTYLYMGDRWDDSSTTSFGNSRYIWLPLTVNGTSLSMPSFYDSWTIDTATGLARTGTTTTVDDGETGTGANRFGYSTGWASGGTPGAYKGGNTYSNTANATATVTFSGTKIEYYAVTDPTHGRVAVSIDNGTETVVDLYSTTRAPNRLVWTSPALSSGSHTLTIRATGTKNTAATGTWATVDRVDITTGTTVDDGETGTGTNTFGYSSGWASAGTAGAYKGGNTYSNTANATATIAFTGTKIEYYAVTDPGHGRVAVSIDNGPETVVDLYSTTRTPNTLVWTSPTLTSGSHTLTIRATGTKNSSATGTWATIDRVHITS